MGHTLPRRILVTGGTRGIGRAICQELASDTHLLIGGRTPETVEEAVALYPHAEPFLCDLTDPEALSRACRAVDTLDGLVLNAGIAFNRRIGNATHEEWMRMLTMNVVAQADLIREVLPLLRASHGRVVAINSGAGYHSGAGGGVYAASKFAIGAITDALREEERGTISVISIHPGRVDTDMQMALQRDAGRAYDASEHMRAESVAKTVRLAMDMSDDAVIETLSIRPSSDDPR